MNPDTPSSNPLPQAETEPPFQPQKPRGKKKLLIGLVAVVILVAIAVVVAMILSPKGKQQATQAEASDTSLYHDRAGYDRKTLEANIGDPLAITMTAKKETQALSDGTTIIPACSVISMDDVQKQDLKLYPNGFGFPVQQHYLSKSGKAQFLPQANQMPLSDETMSCSYGLTADQSVAITVNQAFTATKEVVSNWAESSKYEANITMDGYAIFKKAEPVGASYLLRKNDDAIGVRLVVSDDKKVDSLLKTAVSNLNSFETDPKGISDVAYKSPTFTDPYVKSCDLIDNDDLKQLTGADASTLVREYWPTAVGVADFSKVSDYKTKSNYLRNRCVRTSNTPEYKTLVGTYHHTLQVTATSYENEQAAAQSLVHYSVGDGNTTKAKFDGAGQEAYLYMSDTQPMLSLRQGKTVIDIEYRSYLKTIEPVDLTTYGKQILPVAQNITKKLQSL